MTFTVPLWGRSNEDAPFFMPKPGQRYVLRVPSNVTRQTLDELQTAWKKAHPGVELTVVCGDALTLVGEDAAFQSGRTLIRLGAQLNPGRPATVTMNQATAEAVSRFLDAACGDVERHWPAGLAVGDGAERPGE